MARQKSGQGISIYRIAELAGVSTATVSNVINGKAGVGEATRNKVLDIVRTHQFQPRITKSPTDTVGIFIRSYGKHNPLSNPYVNKILEGIYDTIFAFGFNMMLIPLDRIPTTRDAFRIYCHTKKIDAGIFINLTETDDFILNFENLIPIVTIGSRFESQAIRSVRSDNRSGARDAVKHLIAMGHTGIVFFAPGLRYQDHNERLSGYQEAFEEAGLICKPEHIVNHLYSYEDLDMILDRLFLGDGERATAAFVYNDREALRIANMLTAKGLNIPEDVSIIGFDDDDYARHVTPPLTTVRQPLGEMGQKAAQLVVSLLQHDEKMVLSDDLFETRLVLRRSVKPRGTRAGRTGRAKTKG